MHRNNFVSQLNIKIVKQEFSLEHVGEMSDNSLVQEVTQILIVCVTCPTITALLILSKHDSIHSENYHQIHTNTLRC